MQVVKEIRELLFEDFSAQFEETLNPKPYGVIP